MLSDPYLLDGVLFVVLLVLLFAFVGVLKLFSKKMNAKKALMVGFIIIVVIEVLFFALLSSDTFQKGFQEGIRKNLRESFMEGCVTQPELNDYCSCTADEMLSTMSTEAIVEFEKVVAENPQVPLNEFPPELQKAVEKCAPQSQQVLRDDFMQGCMIKPEYKAYCSCTADEMLATMSVQEIIEFNETAAKNPGIKMDQFPPKFQQAINSCVSKLPQ